MVQIEIPFDFLAVSVPLLGSCHHEAIASASLPGRRRLVYVYLFFFQGYVRMYILDHISIKWC